MGEQQQQSDDLHGEVESLKSDLRKIQSDLSEITDTLWSMGCSSYEQASDSVHEKVEQSMGQVRDYMQRQPLATVAVAFISGLVLGKLFSRR
jgi:ElaB/YqjD/DUF883 family membrane-anchored ribosome-binding protein